MDLPGSLVRLFAVVTQWDMRARGFAFLLLLPVVILGVADWRIRRPR